MRTVQLSVITLAFFASVQALVSLGNCPTDVVSIDFDDYEAEISAEFLHYIVMLDRGFVETFYNL
jgi:hypothetical protein